MASSVDFVVKNGLQVSTNLVVGTYTLNTTPISNGAIISGRVGIGTSNPLQLLHVSNGNAIINNSTWIGNLSITNSTAATSSTTGALTVAGGIGVGGDIYVKNLVLGNGSGGTVQGLPSDGNWLYYYGGTTNPASVELASINNYDTFLGISARGTINWLKGIRATAGIDISGPSGGNALIVQSGNVGIGTTYPFSPLHVFGNITISNTATLGGIVFSDGTFQRTAASGTSLTIVDDAATNADRYVTFTSASGGTITTLNTDASGLFFNPLLARLTVNNGDLVVSNNLEVGEVHIDNATPSTSSTSGAFQVHGGMGVGNGAVIAGNVGIGTTSIDGYTNNALAVFGNSRYNGNIYIFNTTVSTGIVFPDGTFQKTASTGGAGTTGPTGPAGSQGVPGASTSISVISYTTANSSTTAFSTSPYISGTTSSYVTVYVNGVYQPSTSYTWSGSTVTLNSPAPNGANVELVFSVNGSNTNVVTASSGLFINNANIGTSYTLPANYNALSVGPITLNSNVTVTVPAGQRWVIV